MTRHWHPSRSFMLPGNSSDTIIPVWIFYFSLFALIAVLILLPFSGHENMKRKKGTFIEIKGRKLRKRGHFFTLICFISSPLLTLKECVWICFTRLWILNAFGVTAYPGCIWVESPAYWGPYLNIWGSDILLKSTLAVLWRCPVTSTW